MLRQPWFNFGLWIGTDDEPTDDNVIHMTEPLYKALPKNFLSEAFNPESLRSKEDWPELPLQYRRRAWKLLRHNDEPPRMRIVISSQAFEEAVDAVLQAEKERPPSVAEQVQAKIDSYTTDEQRQQRLDALEAIREDTVTMDIALEIGVLRARLHNNKIITAQDLADGFRRMAEAGKLPLYVTIAGKTRKVPLKVIRRG